MADAGPYDANGNLMTDNNTDETNTDAYPAATMQPGAINTEEDDYSSATSLPTPTLFSRCLGQQTLQ